MKLFFFRLAEYVSWYHHTLSIYVTDTVPVSVSIGASIQHTHQYSQYTYSRHIGNTNARRTLVASVCSYPSSICPEYTTAMHSISQFDIAIESNSANNRYSLALKHVIRPYQFHLIKQ